MSAARHTTFSALFALLAGCPQPDGAVECGYADPTALADDAVVEDWGTSLSQFPTFAGSPHALTFTYEDGTEVPATLTVTYANAMLLVTETDRPFCEDRAQLDLTVHLQTDDGALDETFSWVGADDFEPNGSYPYYEMVADAAGGDWPTTHFAGDGSAITAVVGTLFFDADAAHPQLELEAVLGGEQVHVGSAR